MHFGTDRRMIILLDWLCIKSNKQKEQLHMIRKPNGYKQVIFQVGVFQLKMIIRLISYFRQPLIDGYMSLPMSRKQQIVELRYIFTACKHCMSLCAGFFGLLHTEERETLKCVSLRNTFPYLAIVFGTAWNIF